MKLIENHIYIETFQDVGLTFYVYYKLYILQIVCMNESNLGVFLTWTWAVNWTLLQLWRRFHNSMLQQPAREWSYNEVPVRQLLVLSEFRSWAEAIIFLNHHITLKQKVLGTWIMPHQEGSVCAPKFTNSHMAPCRSVWQDCGKKPIISEGFCFAVRHLTDCCTLIHACRYNGHLVCSAYKCHPTGKQF